MLGSMKLFFALEDALPAGAGFSLRSPAHLTALALAAALIAGLCLGFRRASARGRTALRRGVGWAVLALELLRVANLAAHGAFSVYYLPLHLCGLAVFFTLGHALRPGALLGNFLYSTCMPGAAFALLFPDWTAYPVWSFHSLVAFAAHALLVAYPLMLVCGGALRPEPRLLPRCFALLLALAAAVWGFDRLADANYMFLLAPAPGSPLEWFAALLGNPGYLLGYLPMLAAVWAALYLPLRRRARPLF